MAGEVELPGGLRSTEKRKKEGKTDANVQAILMIRSFLHIFRFRRVDPRTGPRTPRLCSPACGNSPVDREHDGVGVVELLEKQVFIQTQK